MDALAGLLEGPRASGAFLLRIVFEPPWSIRVQDQSPLSLIAVTRGAAYLAHDEAEPILVRPGDVAIVRGTDPYVLTSDPAAPPQIIVHPGQRCETLTGVDLRERMSLGVRTWGSGLEGSSTMLLGVYGEIGAVGQRLLDALPPALVVSPDSWDSTLVSVLGSEISKDDPGQEVILDRLLDLLLISALRAWFARPEAQAPAWYHAFGHPIVGQALRLLHDNPARPWTVADLAVTVGVSRAALARGFTDLVGSPPMAYLTEWRLSMAADLLRGSDATLDAVARQVGYGSGFALSAAFKRVRGVSPRKYRGAVPV